jgi:hypothetical protein
MSTTSKKIEDYYSVKPARFNFVTRFEWSVAPLREDYSPQLLMHLTSVSKIESGVELILNFRGVRNLRFGAIGIVQPLLEIRDVSDGQWDRVTFEVRDIENETISFLCQDFFS